MHDMACILGLSPIPAGVMSAWQPASRGQRCPDISCSAPENGKEYVDLNGSTIRTKRTGRPRYPLTGDMGVKCGKVWTGCWPQHSRPGRQTALRSDT